MYKEVQIEEEHRYSNFLVWRVVNLVEYIDVHVVMSFPRFYFSSHLPEDDHFSFLGFSSQSPFVATKIRWRNAVRFNYFLCECGIQKEQ